MVDVTIYSSGALYGPIKPAPHLRYDMRNVKNPPRQVRANLDGRSKKLRDHLMNDKEFVALLQTIRGDILKEIERLAVSQIEVCEESGLKGNIECGEGLDDLRTDKEADPTHEIQQAREKTEQMSSRDPDLVHKGYSTSGDNINEEGPVGSSESFQSSGEDAQRLVVNCFCHLGRHRSASMVEELARLNWPTGIVVGIVHRDIDKDRRKSGKQKWSRKSSRMPGDNDHDAN